MGLPEMIRVVATKLPISLVFWLLALMSCLQARDDLAGMPWPAAVRDFPPGENTAFEAGLYRIHFRVPDDPEIQQAGGSGGPIVEITIRDSRNSWKAVWYPQSVGERLLVNYHQKPQFEIWGRGGGGYWSRGLYRYVAGEYRCVRVDQFENVPRHNNQHAMTATLPSERRGRGDPLADTLYFVETWLPDSE